MKPNRWFRRYYIASLVLSGGVTEEELNVTQAYQTLVEGGRPKLRGMALATTRIEVISRDYKEG